MTAPPKFATFNILQETMALWEQAHPYNGGHAVRLRGRADSRALQEAILTACRAAGVGKLVVDRSRYWYEPLDTVELREIRSGNASPGGLERTITEEINRAFPLEPHHPVRWFVLDQPDTASHWLVAIYRHLAADSVSMRLLIGRVLNLYYRMVQAADQKPLNVYPPDYTELMSLHYRRLGPATVFLRALRLSRQILRAYTPRDTVERGDFSRFRVFETASDLLPRLMKSCNFHQVTVNDAVLAALSEALAATIGNRRKSRLRRAVALLNAVDVRKYADRDLSDCFGVYLGGFVTFLPDPDRQNGGGVLERMVEETRRERTEKRAVGPHWHLRILTRLGRWSRLANKRAWYATVYPLSGSLSHVIFDSSDFTAAGGRILEYVRVPPASRAVPWVLAPTICDKTLSLSLVYREASLSHADAQALIRLFLARLEVFAEER